MDSNVHADTEELRTLWNALDRNQKNFLELNGKMKYELEKAHAFWDDSQYNDFIVKFSRDIYNKIEEMCNGEEGMQHYQTYLGQKIDQLNDYLRIQIQ